MTPGERVPAASTSMTPLRRTMVVGGILLIASAVLASATPAMLSLPEVASGVVFWAGEIAFSAALLVYGFGLGRAGSIVARGPLALSALIVLAAWPFVERIVTLIAPYSPDTRDFFSIWVWVSVCVQLVTAIVIVVRIARAGVVRGSLRWMPLWALVAVVAPQIIAQVVIAGLGVDIGQAEVDGVTMLFGLGQLTALAAPLTLGILSIVHARGVAAEPVQVYPPASADR